MHILWPFSVTVLKLYPGAGFFCTAVCLHFSPWTKSKQNNYPSPSKLLLTPVMLAQIWRRIWNVEFSAETSTIVAHWRKEFFFILCYLLYLTWWKLLPNVLLKNSKFSLSPVSHCQNGQKSMGCFKDFFFFDNSWNVSILKSMNLWYRCWNLRLIGGKNNYQS